jgi:uncharacterized membrane protein
MSDRHLIQATTGLAFAGASIAGYLTYTHYADTRIACPTGGCETVQSSAYALLGPVPVALIGLLAYAAILGSLLLPRETRWAVVLVTALAGTIFSAYLFGVQALELHAFCAWCLASDVVITAVAALAAASFFAVERR